MIKQYVRPTKTHQELLSKQDIKNKLKDYKQVSNIMNVPIGTHIRYFTTKNKEKLFRLGGLLTKIDPQGRFITLSNGQLSWSVQIAGSIFFEKLSEEEVKEEIKKEVTQELLSEEKNKTTEIEQLQKEINKLKKIADNYHELEKKYKNIFKKNEILTDQLSKIKEEIKKKKKKKK